MLSIAPQDRARTLASDGRSGRFNSTYARSAAGSRNSAIGTKTETVTMNDSLDKRIQHRNAVARAHSQVTRGQTPTLMVKEWPAYSGRWREILPIVLVNIVLTFLTVGIYRFWAKTRIRRYFLSRVSFLNDPLEYTGTGLELFKGFLIVLAILVPISIASSFLQQYTMPTDSDLRPLAFFQIGYLLFFYFLYNIAVYRAQRYRLSRTRWRGIRAGQEGSALLYAFFGLIFGVLSFVTIGLLYPVLRRILVGYRINHACFGTDRFSYQGNGLKLFAAWLLPWLVVMSIIGTMAYASWSLGIHALTAESTPAEMERAMQAIFKRFGYIFLGEVVLFLVALGWYRAFEARHWMNNAAFDELKFTSQLNVLHIFLPYAAYLLVMAAIVGGAIYAMVEIGQMFRQGAAPGTPEQVGFVFGIGVVVVLWLVAGLLKPVIVQNWLINNICATLNIQGRFSPDRLFQNQLEIPRSGEGLADALDVDAF